MLDTWNCAPPPLPPPLLSPTLRMNSATQLASISLLQATPCFARSCNTHVNFSSGVISFTFHMQAGKVERDKR